MQLHGRQSAQVCGITDEYRYSCNQAGSIMADLMSMPALNADAKTSAAHC